MEKTKVRSRDRFEEAIGTSDVECRILTMKDLSQTVDFIEKFFTMQNPIRKIFKLTREDIGDYDTVRVSEIINDNASFGFFRKVNNQLISVMMYSVHDKYVENAQTLEKDTSGSPRFMSMRRFMNFLERDLLKDLKTDKILMPVLGATDPRYMGLGLWRNVVLRDKVLKVLRKSQCEYIAAISVSGFTKKNIYENGGFSVLKELKYKDYIDPLTGRKPDMELSDFHTSATVFYQRVPLLKTMSKM